MKLLKRTEAAAATGLTPWELRKGALEGRYPHTRVGNRFYFDVDLLEKTIHAEMMNSVRAQQPQAL